MSRYTDSFRWHNSSFLPAVSIYNQSALPGARSSTRLSLDRRARRRSRPGPGSHALPSVQTEGRTRLSEEALAGSEPFTTPTIQHNNRVQSAALGRPHSPDVESSMYAVSQRGPGSAGHHPHRSVMELPLSASLASLNTVGDTLNHARNEKVRVWERLSVPRHVNRRSPSTVPGLAPGQKDDEKSVALLRKQPSCPVPPSRLHYLYGLPIRRPAMRTYAPFLKHAEQPASRAVVEPEPSGIHIKIPRATRLPSCI